MWGPSGGVEATAGGCFGSSKINLDQRQQKRTDGTGEDEDEFKVAWSQVGKVKGKVKSSNKSSHIYLYIMLYTIQIVSLQR